MRTYTYPGINSKKTVKIVDGDAGAIMRCADGYRNALPIPNNGDYRFDFIQLRPAKEHASNMFPVIVEVYSDLEITNGIRLVNRARAIGLFKSLKQSALSDPVIWDELFSQDFTLLVSEMVDEIMRTAKRNDTLKLPHWEAARHFLSGTMVDQWRFKTTMNVEVAQ